MTIEDLDALNEGFWQQLAAKIPLSEPDEAEALPSLEAIPYAAPVYLQTAPEDSLWAFSS